MIKINDPSFVYEEFGIKDADFYNLDLANDNPKFLNPYEIELIENPVAKKATEVAVDFFETVRQLLFAGKYKDAQRIFCNNMTEPKETCLGYSFRGVYGKGIKELAEEILYQLNQDNATLCRVIKRIEDVKLFMANVSDDRVSDLYTNIIRKVLVDYTREQCEKYNIPMVKKKTAPYWDEYEHCWKTSVELLYVWGKDNLPKFLIPKCFLGKTKYDNSKFNRHVIIPEFINQELQNINSEIITETKNGEKRISKKTMFYEVRKRNIVLNKEFARAFAVSHPNCVDEFRIKLREIREKRMLKKMHKEGG